jgi:hypothetical protein
MRIDITRFQAGDRERWDRFVRESKNGTFLLARDYLEYHADRFEDASRLVECDGSLVAVLPANRVGDQLHSHQGLTYGGLIVGPDMTTPVMLEVFTALHGTLKVEGWRGLHYKTIPHIYHLYPAEEDRYALFRHDARLTRRDVLAVVQPQARAPVQTRRRRGSRKAVSAGITVAEEAAGWAEYWDILTENLQAQHGVPPVHSLAEIQRLAGLFPANIRLFAARDAGVMVAGCVIYDSPRVAHVQYIASSTRGRAVSALDLLFSTLIEHVFSSKPWFDFGISNEQQGRHLNVGLIEMKEGFGARAVAHDFYGVEL